MSKNFIDKAHIFVQGGKGGRGCCSFMGEKYVPMGGPDGGDGGDGGSVILVAKENCDTLIEFKHKAHFRAQAGGFGRSDNKNGAKGKNLYVNVPIGTLVYTDEGDLISDLAINGSEFIVAKGGRGGRGNTHFVTKTNHGPRDHELGEPGEERWIRLELRVVAQVGIIGFPNVGKSTLLSCVTHATPAIADYPFTTLSPVLGVWEKNYRTLVFADIPGLIEGAGNGAGLGHDFLRHIDRTKVLLHLLSLAEVDKDEPLAQYDKIRKELEIYNDTLKDRPEVVAVNKIELEDKQEELEALQEACKKRGIKLHLVSCYTRQGLDELMLDVYETVQNTPDLPKYKIVQEDTPAPENFTISKEDDGWHVIGFRVERAVRMTNLNEDESVNRLQRKFNAWGVEAKLAEAGAKPGDNVIIAGNEFDYNPTPTWVEEIEPDIEPDVRPSQKIRLDNKTQKKFQSLANIAGLRGRGKNKY